MNFADGVAEFGRGDDPADAPTGDGESFAEAIDGDGAIAESAEADGRDVFFVIENDVFVNFIADDEAIELFAEVGEGFELGE